MAMKKTTKTSAKIKRAESVKKVKPLKKRLKAKKIVQKKTSEKSIATKSISKKEKTRKLTFRVKKLQDIKKKLLSQKEALLAEAEEALNALPGQTIFPDMGDQATAEIDRNFMLRLRSREQKLLKKIEDALDRIENGTFGICDGCGMEIDIRRLEARTVTTLCIECKTLQEEEEKLRET